ncbi:MAG TPA: multiheme c-type cytochrome [Polyangia bacterium]|nr:multiheme c-type cytochrome [Polyangia bacterium]
MRARPFRHPRLPLLAGVAALTSIGGPGAAAAPERKLTIFYTAEIHGTPEPCGCTSDPLGDVARYAALARGAARSEAVLLLDGGGLSFPESSTPKEKKANEARAEFLATALGSIGPPFAAGLAETDIIGHATVAPPARLAANLGHGAGVAPSWLKSVGGVRVGIVGVADPALAQDLHATGEDPVAAAKREAADLRSKGAELVIALAPVDKLVARRIARDAAVDLVVLGRQVGKGMARAEKVGNAYLVASADELQRVGRIDIVWRGQGPLVDGGGPEATALRRVEIEQSVARIDKELEAWAAAPSGGDNAFIEGKRREREALRAERGKLDAPWTAPAGSYFTNRLIPLRRSLPRDEKVAAQMRKLDATIAAINLKSAPPPAPKEPGRPYYVGDAKCAPCHKSAAAFWKKTVHASAWKTLVEGGKQNDYKCVSCHVTGYGEVGGSSLGHTDRLRNVQCEVCHGPGSQHVAEEGLEEPLAVHTQTPASTCTACHTEQHSDTFQYEAYLRDIIGPGHGPTARKKLGDGPTGHELRTAALARAKTAGKAQIQN